MRSIQDLHDALLAARSAMLDEILEQVSPEIPFYGTLPLAARRAIGDRLIELLLGAMLAYDPEGVHAWGAETFAMRQRQGVAFGDVLAVLRIIRRIVVRRILEIDAPRAIAGAAVERANDLLDVLVGAAAPVFQRRLDEVIRASEETERSLRESQERWRALAERAPMPMSVLRHGVVLWVNPATVELLGAAAPEELIGKLVYEFIHPDDRPRIREEARRMTGSVGPDAPLSGRIRRLDGGDAYVEVTTQRILYQGDSAIQIALVDVTARKQAEEALRQNAIQKSLIEAQEETLRALSTPLIPLGDGVLVMPLVGRITADRAARILEDLAAGVVAQRASAAIIDITGVPEADAGVGAALVRVAQGIRLLGAEVVLTGIQPAIARTLIELGADLTGMTTRGTLRDGIAHALSRGRPGRVRPRS